MKISPSTTLAELQRIATDLGIVSIVLSPDTVTGIAATIKLKTGGGITRRGKTITEAIAHAVEAIAS